MRDHKEVGYPPIWLAGFAALGAIVGYNWPIAFAYAHSVGAVLVIVAIAIGLLAIVQMKLRRTTLAPFGKPAQLVATGVFRFSRNPIYLADVILLAGLYIYWGAILALPMVPLFALILRDYFIIGEERRLAETFGAKYDAYAARTRRWL